MNDLQKHEMGERIAKRMKELKLTDVAVSEFIGISKVAVGKWRKGETEPTGRNLTKLVEILKTSPAYITTGETSTQIQTQSGQMQSQTLDRRGLGNVVPVDMSAIKLKKAPVLNWVQAGLPTAIGDNTWDEWEFYFDDNYGQNVYWLHIKGNSMTPIFEEGDLILIDMDRHPRAGDYVIAMVDGDNEATFKKYKPCGYDEELGREYCQLIALNDFYPPYDSRYTRINIIGTVVEFKKKFI